MAAIIVIYEKQGSRTRKHFFDASELSVLENSNELKDFTAEKPRYYMTGLSAIPTFRRVVAACQRVAETLNDGTTFTVMREPAPDRILTASGKPGAKKPKYGRGG